MFPTTITITVATGQDRILNRINQDNYGSEYQHIGALDQSTLKIRHSVEGVNSDGVKMRRANVFFEHVKYPTLTDPIKRFSSTVTLRSDPYSAPSLVSDIAKGVNGWLATSTNMLDLASGVN